MRPKRHEARRYRNWPFRFFSLDLSLPVQQKSAEAKQNVMTRSCKTGQDLAFALFLFGPVSVIWAGCNTGCKKLKNGTGPCLVFFFSWACLCHLGKRQGNSMSYQCTKARKGLAFLLLLGWIFRRLVLEYGFGFFWTGSNETGCRANEPELEMTQAKVCQFKQSGLAMKQNSESGLSTNNTITIHYSLPTQQPSFDLRLLLLRFFFGDFPCASFPARSQNRWWSQ